MKAYRVDVQRDEKYWAMWVHGIERATQARHLGEVEVMARDLIHIMTEEPEDSFDLDVRIELPEAARRHLDEAERLRLESAETKRRAATEARAAAAELRAAGLSLRDIGAALGVSHQRAHQLVKAGESAA